MWPMMLLLCFFSASCQENVLVFNPVQMTTVLSQPFFSTFVKTFRPRTELNCPCKYLTSVPAHMLFSIDRAFLIALAMHRKKFCVLQLLRINPGFGHSEYKVNGAKCDRVNSKSKDIFRSKRKPAIQGKQQTQCYLQFTPQRFLWLSDDICCSPILQKWISNLITKFT